MADSKTIKKRRSAPHLERSGRGHDLLHRFGKNAACDVPAIGASVSSPDRPALVALPPAARRRQHLH
jgi:hypothetical protein